MNDISLFHMVDGKHMIGRVSYEASDLIVVERPCEIVIVPSQTKGAPPQLHFAPYSAMYGALPALEVMEVKPIHVINKRDAPQALVDGYLQVTSGLTIARTI